LHRRQQQRDQQADDRDHDEKLYQREGAAKPAVSPGATDSAVGGFDAASG
jgi:hypothetical protein